MNRIILIGNGFDLAHDLPTGFNHFLDYYWDKIFDKIKNTEPFSKYEDEDIVINKVPMNWQDGNSYNSIINTIENSRTDLRYKNPLLKRISEHNSINKWVDIENEYYQLLKKSLKEEKSNYDINTLNKDFERLKISLKEYITDIENNFQLDNDRIKNQIGSKIYEKFSFVDFSELAINRKAEYETERIGNKITEIRKGNLKIEDLSFNDQRLANSLAGTTEYYFKIRKTLVSGSAPNYFDLDPKNFLFLNFNYTKTDKYYRNSFEFGVDYEETPGNNSINIHGSVYDNDYNPIIFGFGDEIDEDYKLLENSNDNKYLEHIKSIQYLETDNYKRLLEFINGEEYQIILFGHSCGISDRTLLNTIFEHENCASIKPYYYQINKNKDNYTDIIMNITRNFNDKASLRDKVVNKRFCESLIV